MGLNLTSVVPRSKPSAIPETMSGPRRTRRLRAQKNFGSVRSCCSCSKATEAPVEGEKHALDIDVRVVSVPEVALTPIPAEVAVVVEMVEIGEAVLGAKRQGVVGD